MLFDTILADARANNFRNFEYRGEFIHKEMIDYILAESIVKQTVPVPHIATASALREGFDYDGSMPGYRGNAADAYASRYRVTIPY